MRKLSNAMVHESDILYERDGYWIKRADYFNGFEVFRVGATHSTRCAAIGYTGQRGLDMAKKEIEKRLKSA
jgi:hypothetical protein